MPLFFFPLGLYTFFLVKVLYFDKFIEGRGGEGGSYSFGLNLDRI